MLYNTQNIIGAIWVEKSIPRLCSIPQNSRFYILDVALVGLFCTFPPYYILCDDFTEEYNMEYILVGVLISYILYIYSLNIYFCFLLI